MGCNKEIKVSNSPV